MEVIISVIAALLVYFFNYREIYSIKIRVKMLKKISEMDEKDRWLIGKFDDIFAEIKKLDSRVSKLEARIGVYVAVAVFVSSAILKFIQV